MKSGKARAVLVISVFIMILSAVSLAMSISGIRKADQTLASLNEQLHSLEAQVEELKAAQEETDNTAIWSVSGIDASRKERDDELAEAMMSLCLTWDSYDTYTANRQSFLDTYFYSEHFIELFFPEVAVKEPTKDGTTYNRIDMYDLNMRYNGMESHVVDIADDGTYSYVAFVSAASHDQYGNEASDQILFLYDVSESGQIGRIDAYTLTA